MRDCAAQQIPTACSLETDTPAGVAEKPRRVHDHSASSFPPETREIAMEHQLLYPFKRFGSLFRGYNFRPLVLRIVWGINILLFASVVWAFAFLLARF
jgi:hypothetical protein